MSEPEKAEYEIASLFLLSGNLCDRAAKSSEVRQQILANRSLIEDTIAQFQYAIRISEERKDAA